MILMMLIMLFQVMIDAVRSIKVMLGVLNNAICEANGLEIADYVTEDEKKEDTQKIKLK